MKEGGEVRAVDAERTGEGKGKGDVVKGRQKSTNDAKNVGIKAC